METKPFDLQSPEQIAKDYGGNKQKIAQAMQMGIIDPTAGTLAAMFIDRMRSAQQQEAAPQQTVAQQIFAPPAPPPMAQQAPAGVPPMAPPGAPAGLGATPEAAAMGMAPPMGAPSMGAIPGMAEGGMVGPYAGGLSDLPVPDGMFDEPSNGGYAGGGLVAFAGGTDEDGVQIAQPPENVDDETILIEGRKPPQPNMNYFPNTPDFVVPQNIYGFKNDLLGNLDVYGEAAPRETKRAQEYMDFLDKLRSPEERAKQRKEDMWMALGQLGAKMASTPGSLLQAASAGIGQALPAIQAANKARRDDQRAVMQAMVAEERMGNKEITDRADKALDMLGKYGSLAEAMKDRTFRNLWENMASADRRYVAQVQRAAGIRQSQIGADATIGAAGISYDERRGVVAQDLYANFDKNAATDTTYSDLLVKDPAAAAKYRDNSVIGTLNRIIPPRPVNLGNY